MLMIRLICLYIGTLKLFSKMPIKLLGMLQVGLYLKTKTAVLCLKSFPDHLFIVHNLNLRLHGQQTAPCFSSLFLTFYLILD